MLIAFQNSHIDVGEYIHLTTSGTLRRLCVLCRYLLGVFQPTNAIVEDLYIPKYHNLLVGLEWKWECSRCNDHVG